MKLIKIYELLYIHNEYGTCLEWHASYKDAEKALAAAKKLAKEEDYSVDGGFIYPRNVKPTKAGILHFLNHNTPSKDNG